MRENDYILANILNPDFTNLDFKEVLDMNMENTQMLPESYYTSKPFITQNAQFLNNDGTFNELKFNNFYKSAVSKFSSFNDEDNLMDNFEYSIFDTSAKPNSKIKDPNLRFLTVANPDRATVGIVGRNKRAESKFSISELAQKSKIFDTRTGKFLDYSPNDISLIKNPFGWFKSLFDEPLVKAVWDEDGTHPDPITGKEVVHKKGQLKLNDQGEYYYETLGDRSPIDKEILSSFDILTVDGEGLNKYDFIDSDGLDKSVTGVIAKTALTIAPLFLGGPARAIYSGVLIAREMAKSLPMLYGMVSSLWGNTEDSKTLNTIAAYGEKFTTGVSLNSKENTFTFENIGSLIGDVALQWSQLKLIANSVNKLRGGSNLIDEATKKALAYYSNLVKRIHQGLKKGTFKDIEMGQYIGDPTKWQESPLGKAALKKFLEPAQKTLKRNMRLGADASLVYMAIISNTDVYKQMLLHGASKRDAAAVAFGSTLGMFSVDRFLGLGEMFFDELRNDTRIAMRNVFNKESEALANQIFNGADAVIKNPELKENALRKLIKKGMDFSKNLTGEFADNVRNHATGFFGKALGEGLEEVSEELVTDLSKQLYELAGEFSPNFINQSGITDVGAWDHAFERYMMSFIGGTLGGGIFYGVDVFQNKSFKRDTSRDELIYLIANNKTGEVLKELDKWKKAGKFGSKNLSISKYEYDESGNKVYLTAENEEDSQNTHIYNVMKLGVLQLENMLNFTKTNLSDAELFKQMVLSEKRFLNLQDYLQGQSYLTKYQEIFRDVTRDLVNTEEALSLANKTKDGTPDGELLPDAAGHEVVNDPVRLLHIQEIEDKLEDLRKLRDSFLKGELSLPFTEKMLFAIDVNLNQPFTSMTYESWLEANHHKTVDQLSPAEKEAYKDEYLKYKLTQQKLDLDQAFEIYKAVKKIVDPHISELSKNAKSFRTSHKALKKLFGEKSPINKLKEITYEDKLEGESEEDYKNRNTKLDTESDDEFRRRQENRSIKVHEYNDKLYKILGEEILKIIKEAKGYIDPSTQRFIHRSFTKRANDVANDKIKAFISSRSKLNLSTEEQLVLEILKKLKPDLSNIKVISEEIKDVYRNPIREGLLKRNKYVLNLAYGLEVLFEDFGYKGKELTPQNLKTLLDTIAEGIKSGDESIKKSFINATTEGYYNELSLKEKDEILNEIWSLDSSGDSDNFLDYYIGELSDAPISELQWGIESGLLQEGYINDFEKISDKVEEQNFLIDNLIPHKIDIANNVISKLNEEITKDPYIKMFRDIDSKVIETNPITKLLKLLNVAIDPLNRSIETILDSLHRKLLGLDSIDDFTLTREEELAIGDALTLLESVGAYIYAAGTDLSYLYPVGHNKVLNEFAKNHSDIYGDFEELPTLDQDIANMYLLEIAKYKKELAEDSPTSWISLSRINQINKRLKLINADSKFTDAKLEFFDVFKLNQGIRKFTINGKDYDLLDGIESVQDDDSHVKLHKIEDLFYINLHKAMLDGITFKLILEETGMLEGLTEDIENITRQTTSELDDTIEYSKLTDFDKFVYLLTVSGISSNEFNNFIKDRVEESSKLEESDKKIVPLTIQEHTSRVAMAQIKNIKIFLDALEYVKEKTSTVKPILDHLVFIDGSAGVGKTLVIAKNASKFVNSDDIWLSAPKDTQINTLKNVIEKGITKTREELFELILDKDTYLKILQELDTEEEDVNGEYVTSQQIENSANYALTLKLDNIQFNSVENPPKLIIIDEITHFSGIELQLLNEFAKQNNIPILALGDTNQNGFTKLSRNIDREKIIAVRSPKLSISLRDVNVQKLNNLLKTLSILNGMSKLDDDIDPLYRQKFDDLKLLIRHLNFEVYNLEDLNGDLIVKDLTSEQVGRLHGKVGFVGDTTNSAAYKALVANNGNIEEVIPLKTEEIQGLEFDYIVVDLNWSLDDSLSDAEVFSFLTNLYTLMSRGKIGSIFIDNNLSNIIGQSKETLTKATAPNLKDALIPFIESKLEILNKLGLISNEDFEALITGLKQTTDEENTSDDESTSDDLTSDDESSDDGSSDDNGGTPPDSDGQGGTPVGDDESLHIEESVETDQDRDNDHKNMDKSIDDTTESTISERLDEIELDKEFPIRIYGSAHFRGMKRRVEKNQDGKEIPIYSRPNSNSNVRTDMEVFMPKGKNELRGGLEIDAVVRQLLDFKSVILYGDDPSKLSASILNIIDIEEFKNIKYKLEVRPFNPETDDFIGRTGLINNGEDGNKPDIGPGGLVYTIIAEFKNKSGEDCKVTLGLLANPQTFRGASKNAIDKGKQAQVLANIQRYQKLFDNITKLYQRDGKFNEDITPQFSGLTNIRRTTGVNERRRNVPVRTLEEFKNYHKYSVVSDPYIFIGSNNRGYNCDNLRGHAVVFVSNDTTLSPNELIDIYMELKKAVKDTKDPKTGKITKYDLFNAPVKPRVRMIKLDVRGVSFRSLTYQYKYRNIYSTTKNVNGKDIINLFPFKEDYTGLRMFTSLWNYRANLYKFLEAYNDFKKDNNLTDEDVTRIARYIDAEYAKTNSDSSTFDDNINEILKTVVTEDEKELVRKFNDSLASSVRQFRIGGSRKESGVYLRQLTNIKADNIYYKDSPDPTKSIGIYITPEAATKLYNLINDLLTQTLGIVDLKTLDGKAWPIDRTISAKDGYRNSLSGLATDALTDGTIQVLEKVLGKVLTYTLKLPDAKSFKYVPIILREVFIAGGHVDDDPEYNYSHVVVGKKSGNPTTISWTKLNNSFLKEKAFGVFDDMLALAFHGTTANIDDKANTIRATDAYFRNGLYVDPIGSTVVENTSGSGLFKRCLTHPSLFTVNVETDMPIFTVTLSTLQEANDNAESSINPPAKEVIVPTELRKKYTDPANVPVDIIGNVEALADSATTLVEFYSELDKILTNHYKTQISNLFGNGDGNIALDTPIEFNLGEVTQTLRQYIELKESVSLDGASISTEPGSISIALADGNTTIEVEYSNIKGITTNKIVSAPEPTGNPVVDDKNKLDQAIDYITNYLNNPNNLRFVEKFKRSYSDVFESLENVDQYEKFENLANFLLNLEGDIEESKVLQDILNTIGQIANGTYCPIL